MHDLGTSRDHGLEVIDYYLSGESFEPDSGAANYTEKLVRLKVAHCFVIARRRLRRFCRACLSRRTLISTAAFNRSSNFIPTSIRCWAKSCGAIAGLSSWPGIRSLLAKLLATFRDDDTDVSDQFTFYARLMPGEEFQSRSGGRCAAGHHLKPAAATRTSKDWPWGRRLSRCPRIPERIGSRWACIDGWTFWIAWPAARKSMWKEIAAARDRRGLY